MSAQPQIERDSSPNHDARDPEKPVDVLLLHYTGMPSGEGALRWLCNPASKVSSHYVVFEDGRTVQLVEEDRRAWHAGRSYWAGETDINARSVGIEIVNPGHQYGYRAFPAVQIAAVIALCRGILARHPIPRRGCSPTRTLRRCGRKTRANCSPGTRCIRRGSATTWRLRRWSTARASGPATAAKRVSALQARFRTYGYGIGDEGVFGPETAAVVRAFQRHFRPALVDGVADASTIDTLARLMAARPAAA